MKRLIFTIFMLAAVTAHAPSASAQNVEFLGIFALTSVTNPCKIFWSVGDTGKSRFTPPKLASNGSSTRITNFYVFFAENYTLPSGKLSNRFKTVSGNGLGRSQFTFSAKMRVTRLSPSKIKAATKFIDMEGEIQNFNSISNCTVKFRATYTKRV